MNLFTASIDSIQLIAEYAKGFRDHRTCALWTRKRNAHECVTLKPRLMKLNHLPTSEEILEATKLLLFLIMTALHEHLRVVTNITKLMITQLGLYNPSN